MHQNHQGNTVKTQISGSCPGLPGKGAWACTMVKSFQADYQYLLRQFRASGVEVGGGKQREGGGKRKGKRYSKERRNMKGKQRIEERTHHYIQLENTGHFSRLETSLNLIFFTIYSKVQVAFKSRIYKSLIFLKI